MAAVDRRIDEVSASFDAQIRPRLAAHLGGATVSGIDDDGVVHIEFTGACTACAYRKNTILGAIYPRLRDVDGVTGVASAGVPVSIAEQKRVATFLDRYER